MYFSASNRIACIRCCLALLLFFVCSFLYGDKAVFRSNEIGMTIEKISDYRRDEFEFVLVVNREEEREVRTLYQDGNEIKRWVTLVLPEKRKLIRLFEKDTLVRETYYHLNRIMEERYISEGNVTEIHTYTYDDKGVKTIEVQNGDGGVLYLLHYVRTASGRLKQVVKRAPDGEAVVSRYNYSRGFLVEEWHGKEGAGEYFRFSDKGNIVSSEKWEGVDLVRVKQYMEDTEDGRKAIEKDYKTGITTYSIYDGEDRIIYEKSAKDEKLIEEVNTIYKEGNLVLKRVHSPGLWEVWEYRYDESDELKKEQYRRNGQLVSVTVITGENRYYEEIYRQEKPFLRIFYEDDVKVKEEFLLNTE